MAGILAAAEVVELLLRGVGMGLLLVVEEQTSGCVEVVGIVPQPSPRIVEEVALMMGLGKQRKVRLHQRRWPQRLKRTIVDG